MKKKEQKKKQVNVDYEIEQKKKQQQTTNGIRKSQCRTETEIAFGQNVQT